ncbi:MAG: ribosome biogenesis protein [Candidatus Aenigmarchaeota archaeon]|nr:ribosome biogenesis protein [Candidatus Aenigmarchaeota archaeon]
MILRKCPNCMKYTLKDDCGTCNIKTVSPHPIKFSIEKEKKYSKYRRKAKL